MMDKSTTGFLVSSFRFNLPRMMIMGIRKKLLVPVTVDLVQLCVFTLEIDDLLTAG
jgi:hypothetical protein